MKPAAGRGDPFTEMTPRFGRIASAFGQRFFSGFAFDEVDAKRLQELGQRGATVFVMRYSSRLDYFLFNWLFLLAGIRLSGFANGIRFYYYRPFGEAFRLLLRGTVQRLRYGFQGMRERGFEYTREIVREGGTIFLFLRTDKIRSQLRRRRGAVETARREVDYLKELVDTCMAHEVPVSLVPLALFWRKGTPTQRRFLNVFYGGAARPSDTGKVLSFLWNYRNLAVRVGKPIDLGEFVAEHREQGSKRVTTLVRRSLLIFLRREEKPVLGAALRPIDRVEQAVLADPEVREAMQAHDASIGRFGVRAETRTRLYLREIAAHPSSTMLAILDVLVSWMFRRLFARVEVNGLDHIVEAAKRCPVVLVPSHRSHFDYLILSWLFYERHLVPPLVAAGINLSFWPLGPIFRRGGAFFLRRSFAGNRLYSTTFRAYVQGLIKDGVTQEFFIEGTRSRTGKTLQPRLGMLGMVLDAFARGVRRDVVIVPVGFTYERLVEEGSMTGERKGQAKQAENLLNLLRAGRVLQNRFGAVTVRFGEPISLAERVDVERYREDEALRRELIDELGYEICGRINDLITAGRSSVSAAALLASPARALRIEEFRDRVRMISDLVLRMGLVRSPNLERCLEQGRPEAAVDLLLQSGVVVRREGSAGDFVEFSENARDQLAYYRATIAPALAWPAALAVSIREGRSRDATVAEAAEWLELLRLEYFPPALGVRRERLAGLLEYFETSGWVSTAEDGSLAATEAGAGQLALFAAQLRPMLECYRALLAAARDLDAPLTRAQLLASARKTLGEQLLLGEAHYSEADCPTTLGNALLLLVEERVLAADGSPRQGDTKISAGPERARVAALLARVADGLETR